MCILHPITLVSAQKINAVTPKKPLLILTSNISGVQELLQAVGPEFFLAVSKSHLVGWSTMYVSCMLHSGIYIRF